MLEGELIHYVWLIFKCNHKFIGLRKYRGLIYSNSLESLKFKLYNY